MQCSEAVMREYHAYISRERAQLQDMPRGKKSWWRRFRLLLQKSSAVASIPALKGPDDKWVLEAKAKADLFVDTFSKKFVLRAAEITDYSDLGSPPNQAQTRYPSLGEKHARDVLQRLREDSGTGPDLLPALILKRCAEVLAKPVLTLFLCILHTGVWPECWLEHWVTPLYKKKSVFQPGNYRGIHLTAQLSKVVERMFKLLYQPFLTTTLAFGPRQFTYTAGRGARDALATLVLTWIWALAAGSKVAVYCSDVSGAFDRVSLERLVSKLKHKGLHPDIVAVLGSWLRQRRAIVVTGGAGSKEMTLSNMVFQGTVTGPDLWNTFFEDARRAINECFYEEVVFADDLNAFRVFPSGTENRAIDYNMKTCQGELHSWGASNQVTFDSSKESRHVLSATDPMGNGFRMLGVSFDEELTMASAVSEIVSAAGWKLKTLLRTRRYYKDSDLIVLYKAHLLSFLEYRTPAIYHDTCAVLSRLDAVQSKFLKDIGVDEVTAIFRFHLAPLSVRRDIAMLGLIHRTVLGKGPALFAQHFKCRGSRSVHDPRIDSKALLVHRSAFGLVAIYNMLPPSVVETRSVSLFQLNLQSLVCKAAQTGHPKWQDMLSPRLALEAHPLVSLL